MKAKKGVGWGILLGLTSFILLAIVVLIYKDTLRARFTGSTLAEEYCIKDGKLPEYTKDGALNACVDCPIRKICSIYESKNSCEENPCGVIGGCKRQGEHCIPLDTDEEPDKG